MTEVKVAVPGETAKTRTHLEGLLTQEEFLIFFDLPKARVAGWVRTLAVNDDEIRFSPGYASAGWGHNQSETPELMPSDINGSAKNLEHEARHGMHNLKCQLLFEGDDNIKYVGYFIKNVLGDEKFIKQIDKAGGSALQERMLNKVRELLELQDLTAEQVKEFSWMFGALTYQHAYFVDPGMCEAAASYRDRGAPYVVGTINRWFATLFMPKTQFLEGYTNPEWQQKFQKADNIHKALLVKSSDYDRNSYWS